MKMLNISTVALSLMLIASAPAVAQKAGPNGGLVAGKDGHETELVIGASEVTVYLLHEDKPQPTKGASIRLVVQESGKTSTIALKDAGGKLVGALPAPLGKGAIVVITGKDDHGHSVSSRYVLK